MNVTFKRFGRATLCATMLLLAPSAGQAAMLLPGTTVVFTSLDILTEPIGAVEASVVQGFVTTGSSGSLTAAVVRNAGGSLDFYYQVTNGSSSTANVSRNANSAFAFLAPSIEFITDVFYRTDAIGGPGGLFSSGSPGATPLTSDRSLDARRVGFNFLGIAPNQTSRILVIRTNAVAFGNGASLITEEGPLSEDTFDAVGTFQPAAAAVPEPASLVLLSSAFAAAGYMARHRTRRRKPTNAA